MTSSAKLWCEEEIEDDLKWVFGVKKILHSGKSKFQDIELLETGPFGKVLVLDGKLQSSEVDEFVYHECLVQPAILHHPNPKAVFIMGGGEGSTAREVLRCKSVEKVVMCDIDEVVVDFCRSHLTDNKEAFADPRLKVVINDARAELEQSTDKFDIIVGDLADPVEGGPCYKLYTKEFYETVVKAKLNPGGLFVTQAGPAGITSFRGVYSPIANTLRQIFTNVIPYATHITSFADTWGWMLASMEPLVIKPPPEVDALIASRLSSPLRFLDGDTLVSISTLSKHVRKGLEAETSLFTEDSLHFIHGHGIAPAASE